MDEFCFRDDFPLLTKHPDYVYFDSAATTLKPKSVIDAFTHYYENYCSNIHRSTHILAEEATILFETVRESVASFIKADRNEIVFTANCSDAINLVPQFLNLTADDEVLVSIFEHHSNYLPWKAACQVRTIPMTSDGIVDLEALEKAITKKTKLISLTYVSNVTGNIQPAHEAIQIAKKHGIYSMIDAAQAVAHFPLDVGSLGCDFMAFSAHKMLGPSGVGVLFCRHDILCRLNPARFGGGMVQEISDAEIRYKPAPLGFEVGTPNIESVIAYGKALEYFCINSFDNITAHLEHLEKYARHALMDLDLLDFPFPIHKNHIATFTFLPKNNRIDLNHFARILSDTYGIATSVGMQCCQPLYLSHGIGGAVRASLYLYNTTADVDRLVNAIKNLSLFM